MFDPRVLCNCAHGCVSLPLDTIMLVISELLPKMQELQASINPANANAAVVDLIRSANLEHVLPKPPALSPRRFMVKYSYLVRLRMD